MWNNLWSVSRYVMGPLSGWWRQSGNDQQCLAAPIWKYRSGFGDHRFTFFIDLRPNYTFYTNLTNIVHWVVAYRDVAHLVRLNLGKSWEKSGKSFDAGLIMKLHRFNWLSVDNEKVKYLFMRKLRRNCSDLWLQENEVIIHRLNQETKINSLPLDLYCRKTTFCSYRHSLSVGRQIKQLDHLCDSL